MSEAGQPYPGFVIRYKGANAANNQYRFIANAGTIEKSDTGTLYNNSEGVTLERKSGLMYLNNIIIPMLDFNQLALPFGTPLTFLANAPTGTTATGTMANQTVSEGVATALTANAYTVSGYIFTGWNTAANGSRPAPKYQN